MLSSVIFHCNFSLIISFKLQKAKASTFRMVAFTELGRRDQLYLLVLPFCYLQ